MLTALDGHALALMCETTAEWLACLAAGREAGRVLQEERGRSVRISAHPMTVQAKLLGAELQKMLASFGLNPAARRNVAVTKAEDDAPAAEDFFSKRGRRAK